MTIAIYGVAYRMPQYFERSIESIIKNASEPLNFTVIDSHSVRSAEMLEIGKRFLAEGKIQRFLAFKENVRGFGMFKALRDFPPDDSEDFFMLTDLDLIVPDNTDWINLTRSAMQTREVSGYRLGLTNYNLPNAGHTDDGTFGNWLMSIQKGFLEREFPTRHNIQDYEIIVRARSRVQIKVDLYHQSWDLPADDPEYFAEKKHTNWMSHPPNMEYEVYE